VYFLVAIFLAYARFNACYFGTVRRVVDLKYHVEEQVLSQLKNSTSFIYSMFTGNKPGRQSSQPTMIPLTLEEKVDGV
jgi:hypothetical protein